MADYSYFSVQGEMEVASPIIYLSSMLKKYISLFIAILFSQYLLAQAPTITSFSPTVGGPGDLITIMGTNFNSSAQIFLAGTRSIFTSLISDSEITAYVPANIVGRGNQIQVIEFLNGQFDTATASGFTWTAAPIILSVEPDTAVAGDTVTITGKYLSPDGPNPPDYALPTVSFGGVSTTSVIALSYSTVQVVVGNGASGSIVFNSCCFGSTTYPTFVYLVPIQLCPPVDSTTFTSNLTGASYQWQLNNGSGYSNISDGINYDSSKTVSLNLFNVPSSNYGYQYRCLVDQDTSNVFTLQFVDTWTGAVNSSWENPANWSCGSMPDANTDVYINGGAVVVLSSNESVRSLTVSPNSSFTIMAPYTLTINH